MADAASQQTPDQELAAIIVAALVSEKLVSPEKKAKLEQGLSGGKIRQDDWRLFVELPLMKESKEQDHAKAD
jgi:hypothetical protein